MIPVRMVVLVLIPPLEATRVTVLKAIKEITVRRVRILSLRNLKKKNR